MLIKGEIERVRPPKHSGLSCKPPYQRETTRIFADDFDDLINGFLEPYSKAWRLLLIPINSFVEFRFRFVPEENRHLRRDDRFRNLLRTSAQGRHRAGFFIACSARRSSSAKSSGETSSSASTSLIRISASSRRWSRVSRRTCASASATLMSPRLPLSTGRIKETRHR